MTLSPSSASIAETPAGNTRTARPVTNVNDLGRFVRSHRRRLGLTQTQFAGPLGITQERVSVLEQGKSAMPSLLALAQIASALDVPLTDVVKAAGFDAGGISPVALAGADPSTGVALLQVVHQLLAIEAVSLHDALTQAASLLASVMAVDKIDAFVYDAPTETLVAVGASETAMGRRQHQIGMDRMPVVNRGREVQVFKTGKSFRSGNAGADSHMLLGTTEGLGVQSILAVPLEVAGVRRGVLVAMDSRRDVFRDVDVIFFETLARWVGMVLQHAEATATLTTAAVATRQGLAEDLMTVLAHDLKNHLTPLSCHLDILQRRAEAAKRSDDLRNIGAARRATKRVSHLAVDLLDAARLEQGFFALQYVRTDLAQLVREAVGDLGVDESLVEMKLPDELAADVDPDRILQALDNVLRNAIRHSPAGTPICVELKVYVRGDTEWTAISVRDRGAGIAPTLLPGIFVRFARGPGSSGLGLGLFVARGVVEAHGGSLVATSTEGMGTTFRFSLPLHMPADSERPVVYDLVEP